MDISIKRSISKNVFSVTVTATPTRTEAEKLKKFGDPLVQIGGTFSNVDIPLSEKKLPSQFPVIMTFDGGELGNTIASNAGREWETTISTRLRHAITEFKAIPDDFAGEDRFTI